MVSNRQRMWNQTLLHSIQIHENDIKVLLELLDPEELQFATTMSNGKKFHLLSEETQNLITEALNILLGQRQESVKILREALASSSTGWANQ